MLDLPKLKADILDNFKDTLNDISKRIDQEKNKKSGSVDLMPLLDKVKQLKSEIEEMPLKCETVDRVNGLLNDLSHAINNFYDKNDMSWLTPTK